MQKSEIEISDWMRIIVGETPPEFFIEIIIRTFFIYLVFMTAMRLMGNRMSGQLNRVERISLITLGVAVATPMQAPERGLIPTIIIAGIVLLVGGAISRRASKHEAFETKALGNIDLLVKDGVLDMKMLKKTTLTRERVFAMLRSKKVMQMGEVRRLYIEASGSFTIIRFSEEIPGLIIIPENDPELRELFQPEDKEVCTVCGNSGWLENYCVNCGNSHRQPAVKSINFPVDAK